MNAYEYAVINEYGAILPETAGWTAQDCEYNAVGKIGPDWQSKGCCICQIVPMPVVGKPAGYWSSPGRLDPSLRSDG